MESYDSCVAMTKSEDDVSKFFFGEQGGEVIWDEDYILPVTGTEMTAMDRAFVREQIEDAKYAPLLSPLHRAPLRRRLRELAEISLPSPVPCAPSFTRCASDLDAPSSLPVVV